MFKYILKFQKMGRAKYCSHLDTVRAMSRAFRRIGMDISYSQGFNPHMQMTFAQPLALGIESDCELMEITVNSPLDVRDTIAKLNESLPEGFFFENIEKNEKKAPFKDLERAQYHITVCGNIPPSDVLKDFFRLDTILMDRRTKSGTKETDIKEMIYELETLSQTEDKLDFLAVISSGNVNLKPNLLCNAIARYTPDLVMDSIEVKRTKLQDKTGVPIG